MAYANDLFMSHDECSKHKRNSRAAQARYGMTLTYYHHLNSWALLILECGSKTVFTTPPPRDLPVANGSRLTRANKQRATGGS